MILADKIIQLRKQQGWSQEDLAERMDVSRQSVSKWESTVSIPDMDKVIKLSKLFGVSTDYLLMDDLEDVEFASYEQADSVKKISLDMANQFLLDSKNSLRKIAAGVMLCIFAPIILIGLVAYNAQFPSLISEEVAVAIGLGFLFTLVFISVMIFINESMKMKKYEYMEKEVFELEYGVSGVLDKRKEIAEDDLRKYLIISIGLIFLAVSQMAIAGMFVDEPFIIYNVCILLLLVGMAVYLLVYYGTVKESFSKLLQEEDYSVKKKVNAQKNETIATVYWCIVVALYLGWSFITFRWDYTWIVWPVAGVLYGAVEAFLNKE